MKRAVRDTWVALDFETATAERDSACALAVVVIEDGVVIGRDSWLIRPPRNRYDERNVRIHGITPEETEDAPSFGELYEQIRPYLEGCHVIAHSAPFDVSVLRASLARHRLPTPDVRYVCSCQMARRAYPHLPNHRLPTLCAHCGIDLDHHDAASDAHACARVTLACRDAVGAATVREALDLLGVSLRAL